MKQRFLISTLFISISMFSYCQVEFPSIEGWQKTAPKEYNQQTLWEYINGAADYYLNYGFEKLEVMEYQKSEDVYLKLEIYQHGNPLNAFGIYAYERPPETSYLDLGAEGYIEHSALNIYGNAWYVKIHSHQSDEATIRTIKELAAKVSAMMGPEATAPDAFGDLPVENRKAHTEKYYPSNFMGLSFFDNAVSAKYPGKKKDYTVFVVQQDSEEKAIETLRKYLDFTNSDKEAVKNEVLVVDDPFNGKVYLQLIGNKITGILDLDNKKLVKEVFK